jgi:hypothetical protein
MLCGLWKTVYHTKVEKQYEAVCIKATGQQTNLSTKYTMMYTLPLLARFQVEHLLNLIVGEAELRLASNKPPAVYQ